MTKTGNMFSDVARKRTAKMNSREIESLARKLRLSENQLRRRLNGETKFSVEETRQLIGALKDPDLADYVLATSPYFAAPEPREQPSVRFDVHDSLHEALIEAHDILRATRKGLKDGRLDLQDREAVFKEIKETERALATLRQTIDRL